MNPSLVVVLATVCINMMGVGLAWPILPSLVQELDGGTISQTAFVYGALAVVFSLTQFLFAPLMGALSDRFGRRPVMLASLTGLGFDMILMALAPSVFWLFVGRLLGGILASTMSTANAFVADQTDPSKRAAGFGMVGAALGVGFIIGPLIGGILGEIDVRLPFYTAAALSFANVIFGYFFLRESLPEEKRSKASLYRANPLSAIRWIGRDTVLIMLGIALMLANTMQRGLESIWVLFTQYQYGWGTQEAGFSLALVGICFVLVQGVLVRKVVPMFGEMKVMIFGFGLSALMYMFLSVNTSGLLGYLGIIPHVIGWGCAAPALQSLASKQVEASEQGYLQGALTGIMGLAAIIGPAIASLTFAWFTREASVLHYPGAFFGIGSFLLVAAAVIGSRAKQA